jgi:pimeloyl-ACP methyl ester carboxylesterase
LYARDYAGPSTDAPIILCLPGLTRNSKDFDELADELRKNYRVICPDQRGRGRSERDPDATHYHPQQYVVDMRVLLDVLGISNAIVIGTSLGGLMAIVMMATDAKRIRAAVLNDVGPEVDPHGIARIASYVGKTTPVADWRTAVEQTAHINRVAFPEYELADWLAMAQRLYVQEGTTPVLDYDPAIAQGVNSGTAAPNLWPIFDAVGATPILVIRGETSDILSAATLAEMTRRMPHIKVQIVPNRGHAPTLNEPLAIVAIRKFLTTLR